MRNIGEKDALESLHGKAVKVFLSARNIALRGTLAGHDDNSVVLQDELGSTVVYKTQVVSITEDVDD